MAQPDYPQIIRDLDAYCGRGGGDWQLISPEMRQGLDLAYTDVQAWLRRYLPDLADPPHPWSVGACVRIREPERHPLYAGQVGKLTGRLAGRKGRDPYYRVRFPAAPDPTYWEAGELEPVGDEEPAAPLHEQREEYGS